MLQLELYCIVFTVCNEWRQISIEHIFDVKGEHMIVLLPLPLPQETFFLFHSLLLSEMPSIAAIKHFAVQYKKKKSKKMENFQNSSKWNVYMRKSLGYFSMVEKFLIRNEFTSGIG